jgi:hypothetical protein
MLRIIVEILPYGQRELRRTIASMNVGNLSDLADVSDYQIDATESANPVAGTPSRSTTCTVVGHDRRTSVWSLVEKAAAEIQRAESDEL